MPSWADLTIYVIDVAGGEKIPRKGGPGITRSDLLVINKIDLAPLVGANLALMEADTLKMRGKRPFVFSNLKSGEVVEAIATFIFLCAGYSTHKRFVLGGEECAAPFAYKTLVSGKTLVAY